MSAKDFKDELSILQREPALITGFITTFIGLLGAVGLQVDDKTTSALTAVVLAALALVGALVIRSQVTPAAVAKAQVELAASGASDSTSVAAPPVAAESSSLTVDAPAPQVEDDPLYDSSAVVPEAPEDGGNPLQSDASGVVDSTEEGGPLDAALKSLEEASAAKADALNQTATALKAVKEEATKAASDYASRIAEAEHKLSEEQAK